MGRKTMDQVASDYVRSQVKKEHSTNPFDSKEAMVEYANAQKEGFYGSVDETVIDSALAYGREETGTRHGMVPFKSKDEAVSFADSSSASFISDFIQNKPEEDMTIEDIDALRPVAGAPVQEITPPQEEVVGPTGLPAQEEMVSAETTTTPKIVKDITNIPQHARVVAKAVTDLGTGMSESKARRLTAILGDLEAAESLKQELMLEDESGEGPKNFYYKSDGTPENLTADGSKKVNNSGVFKGTGIISAPHGTYNDWLGGKFDDQEKLQEKISGAELEAASARQVSEKIIPFDEQMSGLSSRVEALVGKHEDAKGVADNIVRSFKAGNLTFDLDRMISDAARAGRTEDAEALMKLKTEVEDFDYKESKGEKGGSAFAGKVSAMLPFLGKNALASYFTAGVGGSALSYQQGWGDIYSTAMEEGARLGIPKEELHNMATMAANEFAPLYAAAEMGQHITMGLGSGGAKGVQELIKKSLKAGMSNVIKSTTARSVLGKGIGVAVDLGVKTAEETLEEVVQEAFLELGKAKGVGRAVDPTALLKKMADTGVQSAGPMLVITAIMGGKSQTGARARAQIREALGRVNPEAAQEFDATVEKWDSGEITDTELLETADQIGTYFQAAEQIPTAAEAISEARPVTDDEAGQTAQLQEALNEVKETGVDDGAVGQEVAVEQAEEAVVDTDSRTGEAVQETEVSQEEAQEVDAVDPTVTLVQYLQPAKDRKAQLGEDHKNGKITTEEYRSELKKTIDSELSVAVVNYSNLEKPRSLSDYAEGTTTQADLDKARETYISDKIKSLKSLLKNAAETKADYEFLNGAISAYENELAALDLILYGAKDKQQTDGPRAEDGEVDVERADDVDATFDEAMATPDGITETQEDAVIEEFSSEVVEKSDESTKALKNLAVFQRTAEKAGKTVSIEDLVAEAKNEPAFKDLDENTISAIADFSGRHPLTRVKSKPHMRSYESSPVPDGKIRTMIAYDLNHYKKVNDNLGHDVGDDVLVDVNEAVADIEQGNLDVELFHLGGDEFALGVEHTAEQSQEMMSYVDELRGSINGMSIELPADIVARGKTGATAINLGSSFGISGTYLGADKAADVGKKDKKIGRNAIFIDTEGKNTYLNLKASTKEDPTSTYYDDGMTEGGRGEERRSYTKEELVELAKDSGLKVAITEETQDDTQRKADAKRDVQKTDAKEDKLSVESAPTKAEPTTKEQVAPSTKTIEAASDKELKQEIARRESESKGVPYIKEAPTKPDNNVTDTAWQVREEVRKSLSPSDWKAVADSGGRGMSEEGKRTIIAASEDLNSTYTDYTGSAANQDPEFNLAFTDKYATSGNYTADDVVNLIESLPTSKKALRATKAEESKAYKEELAQWEKDAGAVERMGAFDEAKAPKKKANDTSFDFGANLQFAGKKGIAPNAPSRITSQEAIAINNVNEGDDTIGQERTVNGQVYYDTGADADGKFHHFEAYKSREGRRLSNMKSGEVQTYQGVSDRATNYAKNLISKLNIEAPVVLTSKKSSAIQTAFGFNGATMQVNDADGNLIGYNIIIDGDTTKKGKLLDEVMTHEFGHIVMSDKFFGADNSTQEAIIGSYDKWRETMFNAGSGAVDIAKSSMPYFIATEAIQNMTESELSKNTSELDPYWTSFEEWFANQVSLATDSNGAPKSKVQQFFHDLAQAIKKLVRSLRGRTNADVNVDAFIKNVMSTIKSSRNTVNAKGVGTSPVGYKNESEYYSGDDEAQFNLKQWFGSSVVVDEQNEPLVVYDKGDGNFTSNGEAYVGDGDQVTAYLNVQSPVVVSESSVGEKTFFEEDGAFNNFEDAFTEAYNDISDSDISAQRVLDLVVGESFGGGVFASDIISNSGNVTEKIYGYDGELINIDNIINSTFSKMGYDGVVSGVEYKVFKGSQVKAASENSGAYDINSNNIYMTGKHELTAEERELFADNAESRATTAMAKVRAQLKREANAETMREISAGINELASAMYDVTVTATGEIDQQTIIEISKQRDALIKDVSKKVSEIRATSIKAGIKQGKIEKSEQVKRALDKKTDKVSVSKEFLLLQVDGAGYPEGTVSRAKDRVRAAVKTGSIEEYTKISNAITKQADTLRKKYAVKDLERTVKRIPSHMMSGISEDIEAIVAGITTKGMSTKSKAAYENLANLIASDEVKKDVLGSKTLKELGRLQNVQAMDQMDEFDVMEINSRLRLLLDLNGLKKKLHMAQRSRTVNGMIESAKAEIVGQTRYDRGEASKGGGTQDTRTNMDTAKDIVKAVTFTGRFQETTETTLNRVTGIDPDESSLGKAIYGGFHSGTKQHSITINNFSESLQEEIARLGLDVEAFSRLGYDVSHGRPYEQKLMREKGLVHSVDLSSGAVEMTPADMMYIYLASQNDEQRSILTQPIVKAKTAGSEDTYGGVIFASQIDASAGTTAIEPTALIESDVDKIIDTFLELEDGSYKEFADWSRSILDGQVKELVNSMSNKMMGYDLANIDGWVNMMRVPSYNKVYASGKQEGDLQSPGDVFKSVEQDGRLKERQGGNATVVIQDGLRMLVDTFKFASQYNSFADNVRLARDVHAGVKTEMYNRGLSKDWKKLGNWIDTMSGAQATMTDDSGLGGALGTAISNLTTAKLAGGVFVQTAQWASIGTAFQYISPRYSMPALAINVLPHSIPGRQNKVVAREMDELKYVLPEIYNRVNKGSVVNSLGGRTGSTEIYDMLGRTPHSKGQAVQRGLMGLIRDRDAEVMAALWIASKKQYGGVNEKSLGAMDKAVRRTQPASATKDVTGLAIAKRKDVAWRLLTPFTSVTNQQLQIAKWVWNDFRHNPNKTKSDYSKLIASLIVLNLNAAIFISLLDILRNWLKGEKITPALVASTYVKYSFSPSILFRQAEPYVTKAIWENLNKDDMPWFVSQPELGGNLLFSQAEQVIKSTGALVEAIGKHPLDKDGYPGDLTLPAFELVSDITEPIVGVSAKRGKKWLDFAEGVVNRIDSHVMAKEGKVNIDTELKALGLDWEDVIPKDVAVSMSLGDGLTVKQAGLIKRKEYKTMIQEAKSTIQGTIDIDMLNEMALDKFGVEYSELSKAKKKKVIKGIPSSRVFTLGEESIKESVITPMTIDADTRYGFEESGLYEGGKKVE